MTGVGYDPAGNQNQVSLYSLTYDAENRLKTVISSSNGSAQYWYDGDGRRVKKLTCTGNAACTDTSDGVVKTIYAWNTMGELVAEYGPSNEASGTQYLTADHLGSVRLVTDAVGAVVRRHDYRPFGQDLSWVGSTAVNGRSSKYSNTKNAFRYTGKERDTETGLDYFLARYMSSAQGRFTSPDPEGRGGKVPDPQSWNMYSYARNNPLLYTDPTGETYQICVKDDNGKNQCSSVSDEQFAQLQKNPGSGISLSNGDINTFVNGQWAKAGTYWQTDVDLPAGVGMALHAAGASADAEIKKFARDVAIGVGTGLMAGVVIGAAAEGIEALPRVLPFKDADLIQRVSRALTRIGQGAKMYSRDGIPFQNREGLLPSQGPGYYTEYTVEPASGAAGRGAERLVLGKGGEVYYTPNHYGSFVRIQ